MTHDFSGKLLANRYLLRRCIGLGGMATVYEAVDRELNKLVAVKVLNPQYACQAEYLARFKQEAREAARIRHEHLVDVTDQGTTPDGLAFFVMEFLRGETLQQYLHPTPDQCRQVPWKVVVTVVAQICEALQHAHELGVVHRDIKPGNIFLITRRTGDLFIKVLDLGIAKVAQHHRDAAAPPTTRASQGTPGTPEYMSPEQVMGETCTAATDIYALGVVMYRMLTGTLPFYSERSPYEIMDHHCKLQPPLLRTRAPEAEIPVTIEREVLRALAKRPEDRHGSALELAGALRAIAEAELRRDARNREDEDARTHQFRASAPPVRTWARVLSYTTACFGGLALSATLFMVFMLVPIPGLDGDAVALEPRIVVATGPVEPRITPPDAAADPPTAAGTKLASVGTERTAPQGSSQASSPAADTAPPVKGPSDGPGSAGPDAQPVTSDGEPDPESGKDPGRADGDDPTQDTDIADDKPPPPKKPKSDIPDGKMPGADPRPPVEKKPASPVQRLEQAIRGKQKKLSKLCESAKPFPTKERVTATVSIDTAGGIIRNVVIAGSQQATPIGICVQGALKKMTVPRSADGVVLVTVQLTI